MKCIHAKMSLRCPFVQRSGAVQRTGPILYLSRISADFPLSKDHLPGRLQGQGQSDSLNTLPIIPLQ